MTSSEIMQELVDVHNILINVSVKGEDAISMGMVLQRMRSLIMQLQEEKGQ